MTEFEKFLAEWQRNAWAPYRAPRPAIANEFAQAGYLTDEDELALLDKTCDYEEEI
jgi:hypothetical protein